MYHLFAAKDYSGGIFQDYRGVFPDIAAAKAALLPIAGSEWLDWAIIVGTADDGRLVPVETGTIRYSRQYARVQEAEVVVEWSVEREPLSETFDVSGEGLYAHRRGNKDCTEGWCGNAYPKPCSCGGLIHADFGDEDADCNYWLWTKCDRCGERE